jgi:UPF0716 protein FxsA
MGIMGKLAVLFVVVPLLELVLLVQIGQVVGLIPTLALVVTTGVTGAWLARLEGVRTLLQLREELSQGKLPGQSIMDGVSILIGGAFLLTPGIITDLVGFSLLLPFTRRALQRRVRERLQRGLTEGTLNVHVVSSVPWQHPPDSEV